jgi:hypothetical protein
VNLLQGDLGADSNSTIVCDGCGTLVTGSVVAAGSPVPEPRFGAILMLGLSGLGLLGFRKFAAQRA